MHRMSMQLIFKKVIWMVWKLLRYQNTCPIQLHSLDLSSPNLCFCISLWASFTTISFDFNTSRQSFSDKCILTTNTFSRDMGHGFSSSSYYSTWPNFLPQGPYLTLMCCQGPTLCTGTWFLIHIKQANKPIVDHSDGKSHSKGSC